MISFNSGIGFRNLKEQETKQFETEIEKPLDHIKSFHLVTFQTDLKISSHW